MTPSCRIFAIIVAGGRGLRMKADRPKQFLELNGEPILTRTIRVFTQSGIVDEVVLVLPSDEMDYCSEHVLTPFGLDPEVHLVNGGVLRQDSVKNGLEFIRTQFDSPGNDVVMIHDGVRPLVTDRILERGIEAVQETGAAIPAIPVAETVKRSSRDQCVLETIDRQSLYLAQTPQVFRFELIFNGFNHPDVQDETVTDDASIIEMAGGKVVLFDGSRQNIKITTPEDLILAQALLSR